MDLYPGEDPMLAGAKILDYFANVRGEVPSSKPPDLPRASDAGLGPFDEERVIALLKAHKATKVGVDADPMIHLVHTYPEHFARPNAAIFNAVKSSIKWPERWKREHITIIPKTQDRQTSLSVVTSVVPLT